MSLIQGIETLINGPYFDAVKGKFEMQWRALCGEQRKPLETWKCHNSLRVVRDCLHTFFSLFRFLVLFSLAADGHSQHLNALDALGHASLLQFVLGERCKLAAGGQGGIIISPPPSDAITHNHSTLLCSSATLWIHVNLQWRIEILFFFLLPWILGHTWHHHRFSNRPLKWHIELRLFCKANVPRVMGECRRFNEDERLLPLDVIATWGNFDRLALCDSRRR